MRDTWREVALGEIFEPSSDRLGEHVDEPAVYSVSKHDGVIPAENFFGKRIASADLSAYKLLPPGGWVYSTIHIDEGSIARSHMPQMGVVSPMYTVMRWASTLDDPRYLEHLLRSQEMLAVYADTAQGSINRRRSLAWKLFSQIKVVLPPIDEQRRIVDLIGSVDVAIKAAEAEASSRAVARLATIDSLLTVHSTGIRAMLGSLGTFERGKRFTKNDYVPEGLGCIHYGQIYTDYGATATETVSFLDPAFREKARLARPGDLVIAGTGENVKDIGKAVAWLGDDDVAVHDDAYIFRHSLDPIYAAALFASTTFLAQRAPSDSKVARLSAGALSNISVPVLSPDAQQLVGAVMAAFEEDTITAQATAAAFRTIRSNLLTVLLSGEHEIPETYDQLLNLDVEAAV